MLTKIALLSLAFILGLASYEYLNLGHDNALEEFAEDVIEGQTGFELDLSPTSREK